MVAKKNGMLCNTIPLLSPLPRAVKVEFLFAKSLQNITWKSSNYFMMHYLQINMLLLYTKRVLKKVYQSYAEPQLTISTHGCFCTMETPRSLSELLFNVCSPCCVWWVTCHSTINCGLSWRRHDAENRQGSRNAFFFFTVTDLLLENLPRFGTVANFPKILL